MRDWTQRELTVCRNWVLDHETSPKNGKSRKLHMSKQLCEVLSLWRAHMTEVWLKKGLRRPDLVFPSREGTHLDDHAVRRGIDRIVKKAGPEGQCARLQAHVREPPDSERRSLVYLRDQMGHSSIKVTVDTYGHLVPDGNRDAVDRLDEEQKKCKGDAK